MKFKLMSDLHLEFGNPLDFWRKDQEPGMNLLLAGDIDSNILNLADWMKYTCDQFENVVMVAGNHEFYGHYFFNIHEQLGELHNKIDNFHFLENDTVVIDDVTIIGATLWSQPSEHVFSQIADSFKIKYIVTNMTSKDVTHENIVSTTYIKNKLKDTKGKKLVMTHFGPDEFLANKKWAGSSLNSYFWASGFKGYFQYADMWVYGHTHDSGYAVMENCEMICNPYGYENYEKNTEFKHNYILEV